MVQIDDKSIEDTGERMIPAYHKSHAVYGEHIVRYQSALALVKGKVVLDIASGSGYGSALLGSVAEKVYGVDVDEQAVQYSKKNYASKNVEFVKGDGISIPLGDNSVEIVVSFETIEHIADYKTFMSEVKRVLKEDGLFILSTPNDLEFPQTNHFHIHEFEREELRNLVCKYFRNINFYYQGTWLYNALLDEQGLTAEWSASIETIQTAPIKLDKCIYFYMLCSNRQIIETVKPIAAISEHWSERNRQIYEQSIRKHIEEQANIIQHLENEFATKTAELENLRNELHNIYKSKPWKLANLISKIKKKTNTIQ